ncbi:hypothetical protein [uncultured Mameliella sp.]|uniref:hypothetical protein n=1 Tax=uncultured Mameliella sp. TaxID=1447087 RepID=UPI002639BF41|nr:hypothetical protein [uncultured Mameliella sp.]
MAIRDAFQRAALQSPIHQRFKVYRQVNDATNGRPIAGKFDWVENCWGSLRWRDLDSFNGTLGGEVGEAIATLIVDWPLAPGLIEDQDGNYFTVTSALGSDAFYVHTRYEVKRWKGAMPTIRYAEP